MFSRNIIRSDKAIVARLILLFVLVAPSLTATKLKGGVTANEFQPLSGATVRLREEGGQRVLVTITNEEGLYEIPNLKDGQYLLEVEYKGQLLFQRVVSLSGSEISENVDVCAYSPRARWAIRTSILPTANVDSPKKIALQDLMVLPNPDGIMRSDSRYQSMRIPPFPSARRAAEGDIVTTEGWIRVIAAELSNDWEIKISPTIESNETLIAKVPPESCVNSSDLRQSVQTVREKIRTMLGKALQPRATAKPNPVRVRITGQLFFNTMHLGDRQPRTKGGFPAGLWELNPIVAITFEK